MLFDENLQEFVVVKTIYHISRREDYVVNEFYPERRKNVNQQSCQHDILVTWICALAEVIVRNYHRSRFDSKHYIYDLAKIDINFIQVAASHCML